VSVQIKASSKTPASSGTECSASAEFLREAWKRKGRKKAVNQEKPKRKHRQENRSAKETDKIGLRSGQECSRDKQGGGNNNEKTKSNGDGTTSLGLKRRRTKNGERLARHSTKNRGKGKRGKNSF